jgi:acetyltransferase-like isoleucine patch superfamily enzyme
MLPFKQACKLPILVTRNVHLFDLSGEIEIAGPVRFAMVRFGFFGEDTAYWKSNVSLLKIRGKIVFHGECHFGSGVAIRVEPAGLLEIGDNTKISNSAKIICYKSIVIGPNCRIAWETQMIDTTFHFVRDRESQRVFPRDGCIVVGANNWIGNRTSIMKGAVLPDFCIVASGSLCNKAYDIPRDSMIGGAPAKLLKSGIYRALDTEEGQILREHPEFTRI